MSRHRSLGLNLENSHSLYKKIAVWPLLPRASLIKQYANDSSEVAHLKKTKTKKQGNCEAGGCH